MPPLVPSPRIPREYGVRGEIRGAGMVPATAEVVRGSRRHPADTPHALCLVAVAPALGVEVVPLALPERLIIRLGHPTPELG